MPFIKSLVSKRLAYYFKLVAVILYLVRLCLPIRVIWRKG